jgi:hypothetical protein
MGSEARRRQSARNLLKALAVTDTSIEVQNLVRAMIMKRTPSERVRMASDMFESARRMALASLGPSASPEEVRAFLLKRLYPELATPQSGLFCQFR